MEVGFGKGFNEGFGGAAGDGVELDEFDFAFGGAEVDQAGDVGVDFFRDRRAAEDVHEEGLDDDRAHLAVPEDVAHDAVEGDVRAVDEVVIGVGAGVELGPYFAVLGVEPDQGGFDLRLVEKRGVGDQDELDGLRGGTSVFSDELAGGELAGLEEVGAGGGLAVAGEGDIVDAAELVGDFVEGVEFVELAGVDKLEHVGELFAENGELHGLAFVLDFTVDTAVEAVEVAVFVGVEVDADGDAFGAS